MQASRDWSQLRAAHSIVETRLEELLLEPLERRPCREDGILVQAGRGYHRVKEVGGETSIQRKIFVNEQSFVVPPGNWKKQLMSDDEVALVTRENCFSQQPRACFSMDNLRNVLSAKQIEAITQNRTSAGALKNPLPTEKASSLAGCWKYTSSESKEKGLRQQ